MFKVIVFEPTNEKGVIHGGWAGNRVGSKQKISLAIDKDKDQKRRMMAILMISDLGCENELKMVVVL